MPPPPSAICDALVESVASRVVSLGVGADELGGMTVHLVVEGPWGRGVRQSERRAEIRVGGRRRVGAAIGSARNPTSVRHIAVTSVTRGRCILGQVPGPGPRPVVLVTSEDKAQPGRLLLHQAELPPESVLR